MRTVCLLLWGKWGLRARGIFTKHLSLLSIFYIPHTFPVQIPRTRKPHLPQRSRDGVLWSEQGKANSKADSSDRMSARRQRSAMKIRIARAYRYGAIFKPAASCRLVLLLAGTLSCPGRSERHG